MKNIALAPNSGFTLSEEPNQRYIETQKELAESFLCEFYGMTRDAAEWIYESMRAHSEQEDPEHFVALDLSYSEDERKPIASVFRCKNPNAKLKPSNLIAHWQPLPSKEQFLAVFNGMPTEGEA